jgi:hypothetical protein
MKRVLEGFVAWSRDHAGAPCPEVSALGVESTDPWGHVFEITCTDQPGGQIVGAISAGPDGAQGTVDDIASWQLGRDVTDVVHGPRWVVAKPSAPAAPTATASPPKKRTQAPTPKPTKQTTSSPAKTIELDENGLPIAR